MLRLFSPILCLVALPCLAVPEDVIWKGSAAGYELEWSTARITAVRAADRRVVLSTGGPLSPDPRAHVIEVEEGVEDEMDCSGDEKFALQSVVGRHVTVSVSTFDSCVGAAHPSVYQIWIPMDLDERASSQSVDVRRDGTNEPRESVALTDLFRQEDVFDALRSDRYVQKALRESKVDTPGNLTELVAALASEAGCEFGFDTDMLSRFAFHHLEGDKVAVRLGISNQSAHACNKGITELGLLLPIPDALRGPLEDANARRSGFLMKDRKKIAGDRTAGSSYETGGPIWIRERVHPDLPEYYFSALGRFTGAGTITLKKIRVSGVIDDLPVQYADERQMLDVITKMDPLPRDSVVLFVEDLNFDGCQDLGLITSQREEGANNDYWLCDPRSGRFDYLGNYPTLTPDPVEEELTMWTPAGEKAYRIRQGKLVPRGGTPPGRFHEEPR